MLKCTYHELLRETPSWDTQSPWLLYDAVILNVLSGFNYQKIYKQILIQRLKLICYQIVFGVDDECLNLVCFMK